LEYLVWE